MAATRPPSLIWFPSIKRQTPGSIHPIVLWVIGGDYRKVPFDAQLRHSSKMAATAATLDLFSVDFLTNACADWSDFKIKKGRRTVTYFIHKGNST
jgi:hypothetical protein